MNKNENINVVTFNAGTMEIRAYNITTKKVASISVVLMMLILSNKKKSRRIRAKNGYPVTG